MKRPTCEVTREVFPKCDTTFFDRRSKLIVLLLFLASSPVFSQQLKWEPTNGPWGGNVHAFASAKSALYVGLDSNLYRSSDNGNNWTLVPEVTGYDMMSICTNDSNVYVSLLSKVYRSLDNGTSWSLVQSDSSGNPHFYSLSSSGTYVFLTVHSGNGTGLLISSNNGLSWEGNDQFSDTYLTAVLPMGPYLFAHISEGGIFRSSDAGNTWSQLTLPAAPNGGGSIYANQGILFAAGFGTGPTGLFYSTNLGNSWDSSYLGLPKGSYSTPISIGDANLALDAPDSFTYISTNNGNTWRRWMRTQFSILGTGDSEIIGLNGNSLFRSYDTGQAWLNCSHGLNGIIAYPSFASDSMLLSLSNVDYAFQSIDEGESWLPFSLDSSKCTGIHDAGRKLL